MRITGLQLAGMICFFLCAGCMEAKKEPAREHHADSLTMAGWRVQNIVGNFFPLDTSVVIKENNYLFCESNNADTSFVLILRRDKTRVSGAYYETLPAGYFSSEPKMFSITGFSFEQDTSIWTVVLDKSEDLMDTPYDNDARCLDCPSFTVAYNYRSNISDPKSEAKFKQHAVFLKKLLISPIRQAQSE